MIWKAKVACELSYLKKWKGKVEDIFIRVYYMKCELLKFTLEGFTIFMTIIWTRVLFKWNNSSVSVTISNGNQIILN